MTARSSTYESVLRGIANKGGVLRGALLGEQSSMLFEFINDRLQLFWEEAFFKEWLVVEQRYYREGLWEAGTYSFGNIVFIFGDAYYEMTTAGTTTETPSSTATDWTEISDFDRYVPLEQTAQTTPIAQTKIGNIKNIYKNDPRTNQQEQPIAKRISNNGVGAISDTPTSIYIEFSERVRDMSGMVEWDETATYKVDDWIYYERSTIRGEAYEVIVATTAGQSPETTAASFSVLAFPQAATAYVKHGALADWLAAGGGGSELGDTASSVQLASWNNARATEALDRALYNKFGQQTDYTNYALRTG